MIFKKIKDIFPNLSEKLEKISSGDRIIDLLLYKPRSLINRYNFKTIKQANENEQISIVVCVKLHKDNYGFSKKPYKVICYDRNDECLEIIFFNKNFNQAKLKVNDYYIVSGKITNGNQMVHPDKVLHISDFHKLNPIDVSYSLTEGITNYNLSSMMQKILSILDKIEKTPEANEWITEKIIEQNNWQDWRGAIRTIHFPSSELAFEIARKRVAYDEVLALYLGLQKMQDKIFSINKDKIYGDGKLRSLLLSRFGFDLTSDQKNVCDEIFKLQSDVKKALILVQGDVGSGKTIVALMAMLNAAECGKQAVLLAPTSVLAKQHFENFCNLVPEVGIELLLGGISKNKRDEILYRISSGKSKIIVGTHAVLVDDVVFNDLSLVVIDEQHRFGAGQRTKLLEKNKKADLLLVTATPIPRTIAQILFGSIKYLNIKQKPKDRKKIETVIIKKTKLESLLVRLKEVINDGSKIFWVCPIVEENEDLNIISINERFDLLKKYFDKDIDFIHGSLKSNVIDNKINRFKDGELKIILATTVIEVGVDIPDADVIVIENAENFGLAQLHQLRGRVGRGAKKSFCVLIYDDISITEKGYQRLKILKESDDGFYIAEEDFKLRGSGDIFGIKQSGFFKFKFIDERKDRSLFELAAEQVKDIVKNNSMSSYEHLIKMFFSDNNYYL